MEEALLKELEKKNRTQEQWRSGKNYLRPVCCNFSLGKKKSELSHISKNKTNKKIVTFRGGRVQFPISWLGSPPLRM